jgi:hypothetical protein
MNNMREELEQFRSYCSDFPPEIHRISDLLYRRLLYDADMAVEWDDTEIGLNGELVDTSDVGPVRSAARILLYGGVDEFLDRVNKRMVKTIRQYWPETYERCLRYHDNLRNTAADILVPYVPCREDYAELLFPIINALSETGYTVTLYVSTVEKLNSEVNEEQFNVDSIVVGEKILRLRDVRAAESRFKKLEPYLIPLSEYDESINTPRLQDFYEKLCRDEVLFERVLRAVDPTLIYGLHFITYPGYLSALYKQRRGHVPGVVFIQHGAGEQPEGYPFHDYVGADRLIAWGEQELEALIRESQIPNPSVKILGSPKFQQKYKTHDTDRELEDKEIDIFYPSTLQGEYTKESMRTFVQSETAQERTVIYKPHPIGGTNLYEPAMAEGIIHEDQIVERTPVAKVACNSKLVVGTQSTALVQAVALGTPVIQLCPDMSKGNWTKEGFVGVNTPAELDEQVSKLLSDPTYYESVLESERAFVRKKIKNINGADVVSDITSYLDEEITRLEEYESRRAS